MASYQADFAPHPLVGLALQVGDARSFIRHLISKAWVRFSQSASRVHVSQPWGRVETIRGLYNLKLFFGADGVASPDPIYLAIAAIADAILWISVEQVSSLDNVSGTGHL